MQVHTHAHKIESKSTKYQTKVTERNELRIVYASAETAFRKFQRDRLRNVFVVEFLRSSLKWDKKTPWS